MPTHRDRRTRPATPSRTWTLPLEICPLGRHCALCDTCVRAGHARPNRLTMAQAIDYFLCYTSGDVKEATIKSYRLALQPLRELLKPIGKTTTDDLQVVKTILLKRNKRYLTHPTRPTVTDGLSIFTIHKYLRTWRRFFRFLTEEQIIGINPAAKLKLPKLPRREPKHMQPHDLLRLYRAAQLARDRAILGLLADTGIREGGLVSILLDDVDLDLRRVKVHEKGDREFYVRFSQRTTRDLREYIDHERVSSSQRLLVGRHGDLTPSGVYQVLKRLARLAGVSGRYNPHAIRHALARKMLHDGRSLKDVQAVLHHEDAATTARAYMVYLDEEVEALYDTVELLPSDADAERYRPLSRL